MMGQIGQAQAKSQPGRTSPGLSDSWVRSRRALGAPLRVGGHGGTGVAPDPALSCCFVATNRKRTVVDKPTQSVDVTCPNCSHRLTEKARRSGEGAEMRFWCDACGLEFKLKEGPDPAQVREAALKEVKKEAEKMRSVERDSRRR